MDVVQRGDGAKITRQVVVLDAADIAAVSELWAGVLGGHVVEDDNWHSVIDSEGEWLGARVLQEPEETHEPDRFRVYANPAGHPFCLCWVVSS